MRLGEEFDLANTAAPQLEVIVRLGRAGPALFVADAVGQTAHLVDRAEVEAAAPDEGADMVEERLACTDVARTGPRTNERRALPRQRRTFVMRDGRVERDRQRTDFGCRTQAQIDPEDVAFAGDIRQQPHRFARIALGRLARFVPLAPW